MSLLGIWNVRGINGIAKREEMVDLSKKLKFELLVVSEPKIVENGDIT